MSETFDYSLSVLQQFKNAPTMNYLLSGFADMLHIGRTELINKLVNIDQAEGAQLDVIGKWVGASRKVFFNSVEEFDFGFDDVSFYGFDGSGGTFDIKTINTYLNLTDNAFRTLIKMKAYSNISNCSIYDLNFMLSNIFNGRGLCYVRQTGTFEITFYFGFSLTSYEINLIKNRFIPVPAGFAVNIAYI